MQTLKELIEINSYNDNENTAVVKYLIDKFEPHRQRDC